MLAFSIQFTKKSQQGDLVRLRIQLSEEFGFSGIPILASDNNCLYGPLAQLHILFTTGGTVMHRWISIHFKYMLPSLLSWPAPCLFLPYLMCDHGPEVSYFLATQPHYACIALSHQEKKWWISITPFESI